MTLSRSLRLFLALSPLVMSAGCGVADRFSSFDAWTGTAKTTIPGQPQAMAPTPMAGRWTLKSPGQGQCAMIFAAPQTMAEGTIAPEGGCPGKFFTSRKWTFEEPALVIRDNNGDPLGRLLFVDGNFDGQSVVGDPITLVR